MGSELLGCELWLVGRDPNGIAWPVTAVRGLSALLGWKDSEGQALPLPYPMEGRCCCRRGSWAGSCSHGSGHSLNN